MEYIEDIGHSLTYLWNTEEPVKTLLVGGFLWYYGTFTIVPLVFVWGYIVRILKRTHGPGAAPEFEDWRELFVDGAGAYAIWAVFVFVPFLNVLLLKRGSERGTLLVSFAVLFAGGGIAALLIQFGGQAFGIVGGDAPTEIGPTIPSLAQAWDVYLLLVLVWYVIPAAIANYASEGPIRAGFDFKFLRTVVLSPAYLAGWCFFGLLYVLIFAVLPEGADALAGWLFTRFEAAGFDGVGNELSELVVVLANVAAFYLLVTAYAMVGRVWHRMTETRPRPGAPP